MRAPLFARAEPWSESGVRRGSGLGAARNGMEKGVRSRSVIAVVLLILAAGAALWALRGERRPPGSASVPPGAAAPPASAPPASGERGAAQRGEPAFDEGSEGAEAPEAMLPEDADLDRLLEDQQLAEIEAIMPLTAEQRARVRAGIKAAAALMFETLRRGSADELGAARMDDYDILRETLGADAAEQYKAAREEAESRERGEEITQHAERLRQFFALPPEQGALVREALADAAGRADQSLKADLDSLERFPGGLPEVINKARDLQLQILGERLKHVLGADQLAQLPNLPLPPPGGMPLPPPPAEPGLPGERP